MITGNPLINDEYRPGVFSLIEPAVDGLAHHYFDRVKVFGLENIRDDRSNFYGMKHSSHFDYMLLDDVLFKYGKKIPFIAGRENVFKYLFFGGIFNHLGRTITIKKDVPFSDGQKRQYFRLLHNAIGQIVEHDQDLAVFLEGGRNFPGGFGEPDSHLINFVLRLKKNMHFVPVSFKYSYIVEGEFFEKLEKAKKGSPEHILTDVWAFVKNGLEIFYTGIKNGEIVINFYPGFDLTEYLGQPRRAKEVCQRAWQEMKESYVPAATALVAQEIDKVQHGESAKTLEEIAQKHEKPLEILRARRVISREGDVINHYFWRHLLRDAAVVSR